MKSDEVCVNDRIRAFLDRHDGIGALSVSEAAKMFKVTLGRFRGVHRRWRRGRDSVGSPKSKVQVKVRDEVVSYESDQDVDMLVASFDLVVRIKAELKDLPYKKYREDDVFRRSFGLGIDRWRSAMGRYDFSAYRVELPNHRFVWCSEKTAKYLRSRLQDVV